MLRLTFEREKRGLTKAKLAALSDMHASFIGQLESGRLKPFKPWIEKLENVFNMPGEKLFEEVDDNGNSI